MELLPKPRVWVRDPGMSTDDRRTEVFHHQGVAWHQAHPPPRWHRCVPQTIGYMDWFSTTMRCACGAVSKDGKAWVFRNQRIAPAPRPVVRDVNQPTWRSWRERLKRLRWWR